MEKSIHKTANTDILMKIFIFLLYRWCFEISRESAL